MENILKETLQTPICSDYDIVVAGGGPAGVGAAIAAAKQGMKTLLVERYGFFGGMWTAGLINPLFDYKNKGGILKEIVDTLKDRKAWGGMWNDCFQYDEMKYLLDELICKYNATPLFHSTVSRTIIQDGQVKGIVVENKSGRTAYTAKVVIDCTGDADVAANAGCEFLKGRPSDGKLQPMTMMFVLGNIQFEQNDCNTLYQLMEEAQRKHKTDYTIPYTRPYIIQLPERNEAVVQLTHIRGFDATNAFDLTRAEIEGRKQVMDTVRFFQQYVPRLKDVQLLYLAPQIGVRETRRIVGEYTLTADDLIHGRQFEDGITTASFCIDIHNPDNDDQVTVSIQPYHIPYRCMIPKDTGGLLVAGRCISGTHEAFASYRVTGNCMAMGEAAGYAASLAIQNNTDVRAVDTKEILALYAQ